MSFFLLVYLKFLFCVSANFRSKLFSAAEHPSCRRVSAQCLGQWYFIELQLVFDEGAKISTISRSRPLMVCWYAWS
jgi:hypothetical protein